MAQEFAKIDSENRVKSTHVVSEADCQDENGNISEAVGIAYLTKVHGHSAWKQITDARGHCGKMFHYSPGFDLFYPPQPHTSWTLDEAAGKWNPPVPYPTVLEYTYTINNPSDEDHGSSATSSHLPEWDESNQRWISNKNIPDDKKTPATAINVWDPGTGSWVLTNI